jgi:hypothetical protein
MDETHKQPDPGTSAGQKLSFYESLDAQLTQRAAAQHLADQAAISKEEAQNAGLKANETAELKQAQQFRVKAESILRTTYNRKIGLLKGKLAAEEGAGRETAPCLLRSSSWVPFPFAALFLTCSLCFSCVFFSCVCSVLHFVAPATTLLFVHAPLCVVVHLYFFLIVVSGKLASEHHLMRLTDVQMQALVQQRNTTMTELTHTKERLHKLEPEEMKQAAEAGTAMQEIRHSTKVM